MSIQIRPEIQASKDKIVSTRRDIHQYPELAFNEHRTSKLVAERLESFGIEVQTGVGKTGVVGTLKGKNDGKTITIKDIRNYYRVGLPDIGAYEFGASKYILAMTDDITEDKDTTFVELDQELKITVTTGDIEGNLVFSNEKMTWNIFTSQKYV